MKRFWEKVGPPNERGCRLWMGAIHKSGYGHFRLNGKIVEAHRVAFFLQHGRWAEETRHECDTRHCCEPDHLLDGTHADNMADAAARGRMRGARPGNGKAKITPEQRAEIIDLFGAGGTNKSALARAYGVTPTRICQIING